jgi:hypothetical protein
VRLGGRRAPACAAAAPRASLRPLRPAGHCRPASQNGATAMCRPDGKLRYANNSNYKGDNMIRKEVFVNEGMLEQVAFAHPPCTLRSSAVRVAWLGPSRTVPTPLHGGVHDARARARL